MNTATKTGLSLLGIFVVLQVIPYGAAEANPPVTGEPSWDSPETKALFERACADCHSHATKWPWYASIAPVSWLVSHDVKEAREHFNVSAWGVQEHNEGEEAAEEVEQGEMPLRIYTVMHPEADLQPPERRRLIEGLTATFGVQARDGEASDEHATDEHERGQDPSER